MVDEWFQNAHFKECCNRINPNGLNITLIDEVYSRNYKTVNKVQIKITWLIKDFLSSSNDMYNCAKVRL